MSLSSPHPIISSVGSSSYEVNKAVVQLKLLSGRYRSDKLLSHFSPSQSPTCQLNCDQPDSIGDVPHLLIKCSALSQRRLILFEYWNTLATGNPVLISIVQFIQHGTDEDLLQFVLDCSVVPEIIEAVQMCGQDLYKSLFKMTRTFCYSLHRERLKILGRWRILSWKFSHLFEDYDRSFRWNR